MMKGNEMTASAVAAAPEIISPLLFPDTDCVCRLSKKLAAAMCSGCGETIVANIHMPLIAYGFWCEACCPCSAFAATSEEEEAMRQGCSYVPACPAPQVVIPVVPELERDREILAGGHLLKKGQEGLLRIFVLKVGKYQGRSKIVYNLIQDQMPVEDLYKRCAEVGIKGRDVLKRLVKNGVVAVC
ncbi:MAG: hypothetical protein IT318_23005 [Anaerolineales bacterium]|nr:hypothetical protein [Anaerolineales bacterium]